MTGSISSRVRAFAFHPAGFLLLAAAAFFLIDRLAGLGLGRVVESSQHRFARVYRGDREPSIVVLGHSRGVQLVSPEAVREATGIPVFNLSANGMSTEIAEALLLDHADNGGKPAGIILEVTSVCSNNSLIRDLKIFSGRSKRIETILARDEPVLLGTTRLFHSFRYNGDLMPRILFHCFGSDQGLTNFHVATPGFLAETPISADDWKIQEGNPEAVARILDWAKQRGIPVRLVVGPFWPAAERDATVSERIIAALGGVTGEKVWDYSEALADHRFFADHVHLNGDGTLALHRVMLESGFYGPWQDPAGKAKTE
jgi:hypothetical protein